MLVTYGNVCSYTMLLSAHQASSVIGKSALLQANQEQPLTHYMICTCNRLKIDSSSIQSGADHISFSLKEQTGDESWQSYEFSMPAIIDGEKASLGVNGATVVLSGESGSNLSFDNAFVFMASIVDLLDPPVDLSKFLRLKCVYVGQTEPRQDYIRLHGHEKVQQALAEIVHHEPHKEAFIKLLGFQPAFCNAFFIAGITNELRTDWIPNGGLLENVPPEQRSNIIEGALINYFKPHLNVKLKHNFPCSTHTSYSYFYERDFRSVIVELHEDYRPYVTYSDEAPPRKIFFIEYKISADDNGAFIHDNSVQDLDHRVLGREV